MKECICRDVFGCMAGASQASMSLAIWKASPGHLMVLGIAELALTLPMQDFHVHGTELAWPSSPLQSVLKSPALLLHFSAKAAAMPLPHLTRTDWTHWQNSLPCWFHLLPPVPILLKLKCCSTTCCQSCYSCSQDAVAALGWTGPCPAPHTCCISASLLLDSAPISPSFGLYGLLVKLTCTVWMFDR